MSSRHELSETQWERIKGFLPCRKEHMGRTATDDRTFVNGVDWVLRKQPRNYNAGLHKLRNRIERCFSKLKQFLRSATR
jgi:transposase